MRSGIPSISITRLTDALDDGVGERDNLKKV
jgi:hypothetical protein